MATTTILQLPVGTGLTGQEWIECVQNGTSFRIQLSQILQLGGLTNAVNDAAAAAAGVPVGALYRNGSVVMVRVA